MAQDIIDVLNQNAETISRALNDKGVPMSLPALMLEPLKDKNIVESKEQMDVHNIVHGLVSLTDKAKGSKHFGELQKIIEKIDQIITPPQKSDAQEIGKEETLGGRIKKNFENRYHENKASNGDKSPGR